MKIAISTQGQSIEDVIEPRFGRCARFVIIKDGKHEKTIENKGASQAHGAGTAAAQQLADEGVEAVITGETGPNASQALEALGIKVVKANGTIKEALAPYLQVGKAQTLFVPLMDREGETSAVANHFGHAPYFGIYDAAGKKLRIVNNTLNHTGEKSPVDQIVEKHHPTVVYARGIGRRALTLFRERGVAVKTGTHRTVGEVIANIDKLQDQTGDCGH
jgi:predicted Fe-Mo cluster-binding NifX family protein